MTKEARIQRIIMAEEDYLRACNWKPHEYDGYVRWISPTNGYSYPRYLAVSTQKDEDKTFWVNK